MNPNPYLKKLGFSDNDRVVILHADDIGMCQASVAAYQELINFGLLSSAATMVPCGWFPATAVYCQTHQSAHPHIDMGVHLTLTSEWDGYRWGPVSTRNPESGLMDEAGYFYARTKPARDHARPDAVRQEIETQIERALAAGIDVTHIDSHMGSIFHPPLIPAYFETARKYRIPALSLRAQAMKQHWMGGDLSAPELAYVEKLEADGFPLMDEIEGMSLDKPEDRLVEARERLAGLPIGLSYFIVHPSIDTPELREIAPDWRCRVADYELFTSEAWRKTVEESGVKVVGWRAVRDVMRAGMGA